MKKIHLNYLLVIVLSLSLSQKSLSQENLIQGYIVKKEGDTIKGYIDYQNWEENPKIIRFKKDLKLNTNNYTPSSIKEFKVSNNIYVSGIVNTIKSTSESKVFLLTIVAGNKGLYSFKGLKENTNFYIKQNEEFLLLESKNNANTEKYKGQLLYYLSDCPSIKSSINSSSYNAISLSKVFKMYYECIQITPNFINHKKLKIEKGIFVGGSITSLKFSEVNPFILRYLLPKFESSTSFTAGMFFDMILPGNKLKWSLYNEIQYYSYSTSNLDEDISTITSTKISNSFIKLNNLIRYRFLIGNSSMYFNGGITNGFVISKENYKKVVNTIFSNETISEDLAMPFPKPREFGLILGTGVEFNKLSLEARYEVTSGVSGNTPNSSLNKFYILFGYKL